MKMKKKQIIIGGIALFFLIFCYVTLLPHDTKHVMKLDANQKNVNAVKSESNNSTNKFENLYSFAVKINDEVLQVPTDLSTFVKAGWQSTKEIETDPFAFVPIEHSEFVKNGITAYVMIDATEVYPLTMDKYYIASLLITEDLYEDVKVELPKKIILGSSDKEAIIEAYGEPDEIWDYEDEPVRLFYKYDKNQMIMLSLNEEGILSEGLLTYEKPKEALDFSLVAENQQYPERLSTLFNADMFMLDQVIYRLPDKASRLIEQGWLPMDGEEIVPDGASEKLLVDLKKGDQVINVELRNPYEEPTAIAQCYVVSVSFDLDNCDQFQFAGGFDKNATLDDFRKLATAFSVKEVHVDMDRDVMVAYRIKTGTASQFEVLMDYKDNTKINGFRISNYPK